MTLSFGSLFDGVGCFTLGLQRAGLAPSWLVEIDAGCRKVTAGHFPSVPQFADVRECGKANLSPVDVIVGGFPCQGLSVAGKRGGLADVRSGLFYEMARIVDELRPAYLIFENVPGLLSSDGGRDFLRVLRTLDGIGYRGGWTTLDARWFGVAQRRRRIFGVFSCGDSAAGRCAETLALRTRRERHPPKGRKEGATVAGTIAGGAHPSGFNGRDAECGNIAVTLRSRQHAARVNPPGRGGEDDDNLVFQANGSGAFRAAGVSLSSSDDNGSNQVVVAATLNSGGNEGGFRTEPGEHIVTHALRAEGHDASEDGTGRGTPLVVADSRTGVVQGPQQTGDDKTAAPRGLAPTTLPLGESRCGTPEQLPTAFNIIGLGQQGKNHAYEADVTGAIQGKGNSASGNEAGTVVAFNWQSGGDVRHGCRTSHTDALHAGQTPAVHQQMIVRRLTPVECERLQGLPDNWTEALGSDSARYRAIGNGGAVPVMEWIGRRILATLERKD